MGTALNARVSGDGRQVTRFVCKVNIALEVILQGICHFCKFSLHLGLLSR